jgi:hypothetical protein
MNWKYGLLGSVVAAGLALSAPQAMAETVLKVKPSGDV